MILASYPRAGLGAVMTMMLQGIVAIGVIQPDMLCS